MVQPSLWPGAEGGSHQLIFFFGIITKYFIAHGLNHLQPFVARFLKLFLKLKTIGESYKLMFLPPFFLLRHSPTAKSRECPVRQIFLYQVSSVDMLSHDPELHFGQLARRPQLHIAQGPSHAEVQSQRTHHHAHEFLPFLLVSFT